MLVTAIECLLIPYVIIHKQSFQEILHTRIPLIGCQIRFFTKIILVNVEGLSYVFSHFFQGGRICSREQMGSDVEVAKLIPVTKL